MTRKIVRRTYTKLNGESINKVMYAVAPRDANGGECFNEDIEQAHLFKEDFWLTSSFGNCTINGNDRYGDFSYKQEVLNLKIEIEDGSKH